MSEEVAATRAHYDAIADDFARIHRHGFPDLAAELDAFRDRVPAGGVVLDVGCGPGRDLALLRERGLTAYGLDLSLGMLSAGPRSGTAQADMRTLPIRTGSLDGIWCNAALLHIPQEYVPGVVGEFGRVARPGAALCLKVAEGDGEGWEPSPYDAAGRRWFSYQREDGLSTVLAQAGWQMASVERHTSNRDWLTIAATRG